MFPQSAGTEKNPAGSPAAKRAKLGAAPHPPASSSHSHASKAMDPIQSRRENRGPITAARSAPTYIPKHRTHTASGNAPRCHVRCELWWHTHEKAA